MKNHASGTTLLLWDRWNGESAASQEAGWSFSANDEELTRHRCAKCVLRQIFKTFQPKWFFSLTALLPTKEWWFNPQGGIQQTWRSEMFSSCHVSQDGCIQRMLVAAILVVGDQWWLLSKYSRNYCAIVSPISSPLQIKRCCLDQCHLVLQRPVWLFGYDGRGQQPCT